MKTLKRIRWPEQIEHIPWAVPSQKYRRWLKRLMRRARRKDGKLNKDDAIKTNRYYGWEY
jgi:hypothetical protein